MRSSKTIASATGAAAVGNDNNGYIFTGPVTFQSEVGRGRAWNSPHSLPPEIPDFAGRNREISEIEIGISSVNRMVILVTGKPGVGKTSLALHMAYKVASQYEDGALYADLRGIESNPAPPEEIMGRFLAGVGVAEDEIPASNDARLDRYRREFASRKVVMILDNAGSEAQVRPLIPPGGEALVLVTSRSNLSGLEAAHHLFLDVFDDDSSLTFLRNTVGAGVVDGDVSSACKVGSLCGYLPLALRIAGNRLRTVTMAELVEELTDHRNRLEALESGDLAVRAAFNLSFRNLGKSVRNSLKRLSLVPGGDFGTALCGALSDSDERSAKSVLRKLSEANLIEASPRAGRYRFHDLIRLYAQEQFERDSSKKSAAASSRMLDWLSYSALKANLTLNGQIGRFESPSVSIAEIGSIEEAAAWIAEEAANASAAIDLLLRVGDSDRAKALAIQLSSACEVVGDWQAWEDVVTRGIAITESHPDPLFDVLILSSRVNLLRYRREFQQALDLASRIYPRAQEAKDKILLANAAKLLGCLRVDVGDAAGAQPLLEESLSLSKELGLRHAIGQALYNLGTVHRASGRAHEAIAHFEQDLEICIEVGDASGAAETMNTLALTHMEIGEFSKSERYQREALKIFESVGNPHKVSMVCNDLAISLRHQGKAQDALSLHLEDIERSRACGNVSGEALARANAAVLLVELDRDAEAERLFEQAVSVLSALGDELRLARTLLGQMSMLFKAGKADLALDAASKAIEVFLRHGEVRDAVSAHENLALALKDIDEGERALFHAEEAMRIGDGIVSPYLRGASCLAAVIICDDLSRPDLVAKYVTELRAITDKYPEMISHLRKEYEGEGWAVPDDSIGDGAVE
ncbi:Predicted ATP-dependent serine protease [Streptomyces sp. SceaMP-e96]|uniref:ATP-binding protein n=1 Tax=unclassified Streptomyces TaxID=2593676 RepID=UPI0008238701|nr:MULTISPECIES: tetratricopeptide repeat protein [unclassified Streptomyces]MYT16571.1 tetratricopeptide repeat protein [Streptomyces sp. SID4951]SCK33559.1 Predicted ATP-dependent serine protease [Streptomyces sp. SceaMP-e96]